MNPSDSDDDKQPGGPRIALVFNTMTDDERRAVLTAIGDEGPCSQADVVDELAAEDNTMRLSIEQEYLPDLIAIGAVRRGEDGLEITDFGERMLDFAEALDLVGKEAVY